MRKKFARIFMAVVLIMSVIATGSCMTACKKNTEVSENNSTKEEQGLDIRTIYVKTDGTTITKEDKVDAEIVVVDKTGGDSYEDDVVYDTIEQTGTIKVRGNSTAAADKKPFNISFSEEQNVFGMGKAKKWSLLANAFDKSLMRNRLAMELATEMGLDYTSKSTYVDLYINDEYYGNYLLIESVEVGEDRVDIDIDNESDILFEKEYDRVEDDQSYFTTAKYGIRFVINEPEELDVESNHYKNTLSTLNKFERLLEDGDFEGISSFVDIESFVNFYIVNELFKTVDFSYSSTRSYIKDGKLYAGPLWDLDLSSGNAKSTFYRNYYENGESYTGIWCQEFNWYKKLMEMPEFYNMVSKRYKEVQPLITNIINGDKGNSIDAIIKTYGASFDRNYSSKESGGAGWVMSRADSADNISYSEEAKWATYTDSIEFLRQWLIDRNNYLQEEFANEKEETKSNLINVSVLESEDDIILDGNTDGTQSMIGSYSWNENYKWLGYVNFKGRVNSEYKYLVMDFTGDISSMRLQFVANAGNENEEMSDIYWFRDVDNDWSFVSADEREFPFAENEGTVVIDLEESGVEIDKYNSGLHMHIGTDAVPKGELNITDARLVKSVVIE